MLIDGVGDVQQMLDSSAGCALSSLEKSMTPVLDSISRTYGLFI